MQSSSANQLTFLTGVQHVSLLTADSCSLFSNYFNLASGTVNDFWPQEQIMFKAGAASYSYKKKKSINIYNILCVCLKYLWKKTQETDKNGCLQEGKLDNKE